MAAHVLLDLLTGSALFLSLAVSIGAAVARWIVLPPASPDPNWNLPEDRVAVARIGVTSTRLLFVALALVFGRQVVEFHDPFAPWGDDIRLLLGGTAWGTSWMVAVGGAVAATMGFAWARAERRGGWPLATLAVLGLGAFPASTGHANAGDLRAVTLAADTLHVWAMGAWIGTLSIVLLLERRHRAAWTGPAEASLLPVLVPRFSPVAMAAVGTLVITGVLAAWLHLGSVGALVGSRYGRLLLVKVALVLATLGFGAWNWRRLTPRLSDPDGPPSMRRAATLELVAANLVLLVTALLVRTSPR